MNFRFHVSGPKEILIWQFNLFDMFFLGMCRNLIRLILHLFFQFSHHQSAWTRSQAFLDALVCPVGGVVSDTKIVQKVEWFQSYTPGKRGNILLRGSTNNPANKLEYCKHFHYFRVFFLCISQLVVCWISSMKHRQSISPYHSEVTKFFWKKCLSYLSSPHTCGEKKKFRAVLFQPHTTSPKPRLQIRPASCDKCPICFQIQPQKTKMKHENSSGFWRENSFPNI